MARQPGPTGLFRDKNKMFFSTTKWPQKSAGSANGTEFNVFAQFFNFVLFRGQLISCFLVLFSDWATPKSRASSVLLGFARFCSVSFGLALGRGGGFRPRVSLHVFQTRFFNCTHLYSAVLTYSHIKNKFFYFYIISKTHELVTCLCPLPDLSLQIRIGLTRS